MSVSEQMQTKSIGQKDDTNLPRPNYPKSTLIKDAAFSYERTYYCPGDMWPCTWCADDSICTLCGDLYLDEYGYLSNCSSYKVLGTPETEVTMELLSYAPVDFEYVKTLPDVHETFYVKPSGLISVNGTLYISVSSMNYGEKAHGYRQRYPNCWIAVSNDHGATWDNNVTPYNFFSGRLSGLTFIQYGKDNAGARDEYVYAVFPCSYSGHAYWECQDCLLLGRVPADSILNRKAWEFRTQDGSWDCDDTKAAPVFEYPGMTGQDFIQYNEGLGRYILGNYGFMTIKGEPRPYHTGEWTSGETKYPSQLTLFEAPNPWGPWSLFYLDDNWGTFGGYQPSFPTKFISKDGLTMYMASSGSYNDYHFTLQKLYLFK